MIVQISIILGVLSYVLATGLFAVEAWPDSKRQSLFVILLPGYVVYFAFINSRRELPFRLLLMASIILTVVVPIIVDVILRANAQ